MLIILANSHFVPIKDPAIRSETIERAEVLGRELLWSASSSSP
jgi:hypothetical protein